MFFQQVTNTVDIEAAVPLALFESRKERLQSESGQRSNTTTDPKQSSPYRVREQYVFDV